MKVIPFAVGLVGGIPIVSREIEGRTVQTAWSPNPSRVRWLLRQAGPILLMLGVAVMFAGLATTALASDLEDVAEQAVDAIGSHGLPAVARMIAAFGLGVFFGAVVGRALPALVLGAVVGLMLFTAATEAREAWLRSQAPVAPVTDPAVAVQTQWALIAPDGTQYSLGDAAELAPPGEPSPEAYLEASGYEWLPLGIPRDVALGWGWIDAGISMLVAGIALAGAIQVVQVRRPI